ncbi:helix-turn-helix domain-containing protein [Paenibacillus doosanensis]|uniref:helix-turn-helix domain-containing protein n=1 Tax=Paenibacillus doosanensis TaxID=1229154 RepID=UPI0021805694|nr:helix-turn-helix domain-containing protein [Paenibacillus doosanensis]MCS7458568.1 helix-turn-helix domain-containing protein [Paenibacillus doosanensis]
MSKKWFYRLLLSYIPVFFVVTAFLFFIFFQTLSEQNKKETIKANDFVAQQAIRYIDYSLKAIDEKVTLELLRNSDVARYFSSGGADDLKLDVAVMNAMRDLKVTYPLIDSMYVIRFRDDTVLSNIGSYALRDYPDEPFIARMRKAPNSVWSDSRAFKQFAYEEGVQVVSLTRGFPVFSQEKGMLVLNVRTDALHAIARQMYNPEVSFVRLYDRQGSDLMEAAAGDAFSPEEGKVYASYVSDYTGWRMDSGIRREGLIGLVLGLYNVWISLGILVVLGAIAWMIYVTRRNYKPIELIVSRLQLYLDYKARFIGGGANANEFKFIESALDNMIEQSNHWERQYYQDLGVRRNYFIHGLLEGTRRVDAEEWSREADGLMMPATFGMQTVFVVEIDKYTEFCKEYSHRDQNLFKFVISKMVEETAVSGTETVWTLWTASHQLTCVLRIDDGTKTSIEHIEMFEKIRSWMEVNLQLTVTIGIGGLTGRPEGLRDSFKEAQEALRFKTIYGGNGLLVHERLPSKGEANEQLQLIMDIASDYRMSQGRWRSDLQTLFREMYRSVLSREDVVTLLRSLTFHLDRAVSAMGAHLQERWKKDAYPKLLGLLDSFETLEEIEDGYPAVLERFALQMDELREAKHPQFAIHEVKAYLEQHVMNPNLSLDFLSEKFGMNGKYLSKAFKEAYGVKFVDFMIDLRMQHAKRLLTETDRTVQEIAENVGYSSAISFIRTFKKMTGMSPGDYRKGN